MIVKKEDMYTLLVDQEELDIIADCISATVINLEDEQEEEHTAERYKEFLKMLTPFTRIFTGIERKE